MPCFADAIKIPSRTPCQKPFGACDVCQIRLYALWNVREQLSNLH